MIHLTFCLTKVPFSETELRGTFAALQALIEGLPADSELAGDLGLACAGRDPRAQPLDSIGGEGLFASSVGTPLFGQADPFALALMDEGPLKFGSMRCTAY
jgi:hypothetical protein